MDTYEITPLPTESALAFEYFKIYCEIPPAQRSLQKLCDREVTGKKRTVGVFKRWSTQHKWQARAAQHDAHTQRIAAAKLLERRVAEIEEFIEKDMQTSLDFQQLCIEALAQLKNQNNIDPKILRQWAMAYRECREWIKELIGINQLQEQEDADDAEQAE